MNDDFIGDIGDFGKYGLLEALQGSTRLKLGVVWYYTGRDGRRKPDNHAVFSHLRDAKSPYRAGNPLLFDALKTICRKGLPSILDVERYGVLKGAIFHAERLNIPPGDMRAGWVEDANKDMGDANVVFLDPDNGFPRDDLKIAGPEHILPDDLVPFWRAGRSLVVYHHHNHEGTAQDQATLWAKTCSQYLADSSRRRPAVRVLLWKPVSQRLYFVFAQPSHEEAVAKWLSALLASPWAAWFSELPSDIRGSGA